MSRGYSKNYSKYTSELTSLPKTKINDRGVRPPVLTPSYLYLQSMYGELIKANVSSEEEFLFVTSKVNISLSDKEFLRKVYKFKN